MATVRIQPLFVPETFRHTGAGPVNGPPHSLLADIPRGTPTVLNADGCFEPAAVDQSNYVTSANALYSVTYEDFLAARAVAGATPIKQTSVGQMILFSHVHIEGNFYHDGDGDADDAITRTLVGELVVLLKLASGVYVFDSVADPAGLATFRVVALKDEIGTVYGRIYAIPTASYRLF